MKYYALITNPLEDTICLDTVVAKSKEEAYENCESMRSFDNALIFAKKELRILKRLIDKQLNDKLQKQGIVPVFLCKKGGD